MRLFPILAAIVVSALIYAFVFERERLQEAMAEAAGTSAAQEAESAPEEAESPAAEAEVVRVVAVRSTARQIDQAVTVRGQTEADREVMLRAETSGQITSEPLRKGSFVEEGQMLCELDPGTRQSVLTETRARLAEARARVPESQARVPEAQARVEEARSRLTEAESRLAEAEINFNAASKLSEEGFASTTRVAATEAAVRGAEAGVVSARAGLRAAESGLETVAAGIESAKAQVESAQAAVAAAEREIERLTITAPFSGLLESDSAEIGSLLQPGDLCATVIRLDPIMLVGFVPETAVTRVELGARAGAELASGDRVEGEVVFISRAADETTRTFRVEIEVPNPELKLRDGQTAEIVISAEGTTAHLLPQSALTLNDEGTLGVRIVEEGDLVAFKAVTLLRDTPNGVWLTGLDEEASVIVIGQEYVTDGVKVEPSYQEIGQ
ncbi:MAG: efflux RND transporter periplasmic adaptor subunit [Roseovarius sp.]|jgi:multidrug efflux system membrane fusion protein